MRRSVHADTRGRGPMYHSWLSAAWKRNKNAIQAIVKPIVSHIPVVGDTVASRILMSPTAAQSNLSSATNSALTSIGARAQLVTAEQNGTLPTPVGMALAALPPGITGPQLAIGAVLLLGLVYLSMRRK